jgi:hypothetical protein
MITIRHKIQNAEAKSLYGTPVVLCELLSGARLQLQAHFRDIAHAERTAAKVLARGTVDVSLWAPLPSAAAVAPARTQGLTGEAYRARHQREQLGLAA